MRSNSGEKKSWMREQKQAKDFNICAKMFQIQGNRTSLKEKTVVKITIYTSLYMCICACVCMYVCARVSFPC